jgi:hypothetical protein
MSGLTAATRARDQEILETLLDYIIKFVKEFEKIDITDGLKSQG